MKKRRRLDIKAMRRASGLTQEKFAAQLGIDRSHLSRLERGEREPIGPLKLLLDTMRANGGVS